MAITGVYTKHPDVVLSSADTSIKVTVLPLTYAGMHFLYQNQFTMHYPIATNIYLHFLDTIHQKDIEINKNHMGIWNLEKQSKIKQLTCFRPGMA